MRVSIRGALLAVCAALALSTSAEAAERPSFLHIMTDDQTVDSVRHMPNTRRVLERRGTSFTNYHAVQPLCCPSRASFLTGQYSHNHDVLTNLPPYGYQAMDFSRTLYTAMQAAGYRTGWIGKVLNSVGSQGRAPEPGFEEWLTPLGATQSDYFNLDVSDNGTVREIRDRYQTDFYGARARRFIRASDERPFLLTLSLFTPHWSRCRDGAPGFCPPTPAPRDLGSFAGERFPFHEDQRVKRSTRREANRWWRRELESLQSVDRLVAALIRELRRAGRLDETVVIFQSDNGFEHGEHGRFVKNVPWDRSVRVPLLIRGPGFAAGARRDDLTANVDLPLTILDAAGADPPLPPDGHSLLDGRRRKALLLERLVGRTRRGTSPWLQLKTAKGWTYWRFPSTGDERLYYLPRDPAQARNLVSRRPGLLRRLRVRARQAADCANPCP